MKIHMIGIGGTSMRGLAQYLVRAGHEVSGCDAVPVMIDEIPIALGHDPAHIDQTFDRVIFSSAVSPSAPAWPELQAAKTLKIEAVRRARAIGEITRGRQTLTISGAHGKSTTTGMLVHCFIELDRDPLMMLGAPLPELGGQSDEWGKGSAFRWGDGPFVLEADEYDRSFYEFVPDIAILTNIEAEHLDYFTGGLPEIIETFATFAAGSKPNATVLYCVDDSNVLAAVSQVRTKRSDLRFVSYGRATDSDYAVVSHELEAGQNIFTVKDPAGRTHEIRLAIPGAHNQLNAAAVFAASRILGLASPDIVRALGSFSGVGRRFDLLLDRGGEKVVFDYGHHPTELRVTIEAARAWYQGEPIRVIFQPHQYARTKLLFDDFVDALALADDVVVTDIYGVAGREEQTDVSAQGLASAIVARSGITARYVALPALERWIADNHWAGVTFLMGAGRDIRVLAQTLASGHVQ